MKTIVIHPTDSSTTFLKYSYEGLDCDVINDFNGITKEELKEKLSNYDRIIMMGHGCGSGLFNPQGGGILIDDSFADLLREKESLSIWCFSDQYFKRNHIGGFHTGMIISEVSEESWALHKVALDEQQMYDNMVMFSKALRKAFDSNSPSEQVNIVLENYVGDDDVTQYNRGHIYNLTESDFTPVYTAMGNRFRKETDDAKKLDWKPTYIWDDDSYSVSKDYDGYDYTYADPYDDDDDYYRDGYEEGDIDENGEWIPKLTRIDDFAMADDTNLVRISIPDTVRTIGDYSLSGCTNLEELTIEEGVKDIGVGAFSFCNSLKTFTLPHSLRSIGKGAFFDIPSDIKYNGTKNDFERIVKDAHWGDGFHGKIICKDGDVVVDVKPEVEEEEK